MASTSEDAPRLQFLLIGVQNFAFISHQPAAEVADLYQFSSPFHFR